MTSQPDHRVSACRVAGWLASDHVCCCSHGSPDQGKEQKGGESPRVMNLDLRA